VDKLYKRNMMGIVVFSAELNIFLFISDVYLSNIL
jgi:hypothetical protein